MAKKEFKSGLDNLFQSTIERDETPNENNPIVEKHKEVRATFIIDENQLEILKAIAYWERKQIKQIHANAISQYILTYTEEDIQTLLTAFKSPKS